MADTLSGPVPFKLQGRVASANDRESRYQVEADLKDSKITELLARLVEGRRPRERASPSRWSTSRR